MDLQERPDRWQLLMEEQAGLEMHEQAGVDVERVMAGWAQCAGVDVKKAMAGC